MGLKAGPAATGFQWTAPLSAPRYVEDPRTDVVHGVEVVAALVKAQRPQQPLHFRAPLLMQVLVANQRALFAGMSDRLVN